MMYLKKGTIVTPKCGLNVTPKWGLKFLPFKCVIRNTKNNILLRCLTSNFGVQITPYLKITLFVFSFCSLEGDCFVHKIRFDGKNFPPNGPVMQKKALRWEPSTEKLYVRDGVLVGDINMALLLKDGGHQRCDFKTTYK